MQRLDADKTRLTASATFHLFGKGPGVAIEFANVQPWSNLEKPWMIAIKDGDGIETLDWSTFRIEQVNADVAFEDWFIYYLTRVMPLRDEEAAEIEFEKEPSSDTLSLIIARFGHKVDRCRLLFSFPMRQKSSG